MQPHVSRREALRVIGLLAGGTLAGCAPARIALKWAPAEYAAGSALLGRVLRAFVSTVIPGADPNGRNVARVFVDRDYPFAPYAATFAADLSGRARRLFGVAHFDQLGARERTTVVQDALQANVATRKLYTGAIFIAQVAFYSGIYDDDGCAIIGFEGRFRLRSPQELCRHDPGAYMARAISLDGNPG